jgi:ATP-dependent Zn protease
MKFTLAVIAALLTTDTNVAAFVSPSSYGYTASTKSTSRLMDMPVPAATTTTTSDLPAVQPNTYGQPSDIRYSDFLKLVNNDRIEKVTFSSDGTQLLGVDTDGVRVKIEALPNDPDLLTQLTSHKVLLFSDEFFFAKYVSHKVFLMFYNLYTLYRLM